MSTQSRLFASACLALLLVALPGIVPRASANTLEVGGIVVRQEPMMTPERNYHGYTEYKFSVKNRSQTTRRVTLYIGGRVSSSYHMQTLSRTVVVGPGSTSMVSIFQPSVTLSASSVSITIDGRSPTPDTLSIRHAYRYFNTYYYRRQKNISVLLSPSLPVRLHSTLTKASKRYAKGSYRSRTWYKLHRSNLPTSQWSRHWLAYSRFDGIALSDKELSAMPDPVRRALFLAVQGGVSLFIFGDGFKAPKTWDSFEGVSWKRYLVGFGKVLQMGPATTTASFSSAASAPILDRDQTRALFSMWRRSSRPWGLKKTIKQANIRFPVVENLSVPARGIFLLMLLFSILIGPINLLFLSKRKRRIWMLWTVPVGALFATLMVLGYAIVSEGWNGYLRVENLTYLDQRTRHATTLGWNAYYMPLTPASGLRFDFDTEVDPQIRSSSYFRRSGRGFMLDWSRDQHLSTGWIASRIPLHLRIRRCQRRRERLVLSMQGGKPTITNGLGAPIERLWLADGRGRIFSAASVAEGAKVPLTLTYKSASGSPLLLRGLYADSWLLHKSLLTNTPGKYLFANTYIAQLKASPFLQAGISKIKFRTLRSVVFGRMQGKAP